MAATAEEHAAVSSLDNTSEADIIAAPAEAAATPATVPPVEARAAGAGAGGAAGAAVAPPPAAEAEAAAGPKRKRRNVSFEETAEGWSKPLKWLTQCDPVKLHRHTLEWIELVRRCGHAQKRSGHNLNAYAGSKPVSLQLTVLDLQLPPPPPCASPRKSVSSEARDGCDRPTTTAKTSAAADEASGADMEAMSDSDNPVSGPSDAGATGNVAAHAAARAILPAAEKPPTPDGNDEDNVARILRLAAKPSGLDADEAVWLATTIDQALALLDHGTLFPILLAPVVSSEPSAILPVAIR
eukprot:COSAG02_NODE_2720_length_8165_cov_166.651748_3_plen_297_part_00